MQKGNTLMLIRDIARNPLDPANTPTPQYVGLASAFRLATLNLRWDTQLAQGIGLRLDGDYIRNLAYDKQAMFSRANNGIVNNYGAGGTASIDTFRSGDTAWMVQATFGATDLKEKGQWQALLATSASRPMRCRTPTTTRTSTSGHQRPRLLRGRRLRAGRAQLDQRQVDGGHEVSGAPLSIDVFQLEFNTGF